jgi:hypothetical protein
MRTISGSGQAILDGGLKGYRVKVEIQETGSINFRDMSTYPGFDSVLSVDINESIDNPVATASVSLRRELDGISIAPLVSSGPNNGFVPSNSNIPLIQVSNEIKIYIAAMPGETPPGANDWHFVFHGLIDSIDVSDYALRLECRDLAAKLLDAYIEKERVYCAAAVSTVPVGIRIWAPGEVWVDNEFVMPTEAKRNVSGIPAYFEVISGGTAGIFEPTWSILSTTTDGTALLDYVSNLTPTVGYPVEKVMQQILNDNGLSAFTIAVPVSPGWNILMFKQERTSVFEAIRALATQIGWDLRMKFQVSTSSFVLTFYDPNRTKTTADYTFDSDDYEQLSSVSVDKSEIRNVIQVVYEDRASLAPLGQSKRTVLQVSDAASIIKYGRLFMEIQEGESSNIDSAAEAATMANAALSDLAEPTLSHVAELSFGFPYAQLNDLYEFVGNGKHYSSNQKLACLGISHSLSGGAMRTTLQCRGKPSAGLRIWSSANVRPVGTPQIYSTDTLATEQGISIQSSPLSGGIRLFYSSKATLKPVPLQYETHISQTSGFTPDLNSLVQYGPETQVEVAKLNPGATYYAKMVPFYYENGKLVRGYPSEQYQFTAGRAVSGHLPSDVQYWRQPLNGNLDNRFQDDARKDELPDHWNLKTGTLGTQVIPKYDDTAGVGNAISGKYYIRFATSSSTGAIESDSMIIEGGRRYRLTVLAKNISGTGSWSAKVNFLKYDKTAQSTETVSQLVTADVGSFVDRVWYFNAPSAARYAKIEITTATTSTQSFDIDSVRLDEAAEIARYYHTAGASIANATATLINFDTAFDSQTNANVTTGAAWKYTAPRIGYYLLQTAVTIVYGNNDSGTAYLEVFKNGAVHRRIWRQSGHVLREETQYMASCVLYLAKGDYIHVSIYQSTGTARNLEGGTQTYVEIMQLD